MLPSRILIANRGEIACRIIDTCRKLGIETVAVYSSADARAKHVRAADRSVLIGDSAVAQSYLNAGAVIDAAIKSCADAIHPGYGFLSENAGFARQVVQNGLLWIGPPAESIDLMGNKIRARELMAACDVPVIPGSIGAIDDDADAHEIARAIGYPVVLKPAAGGGRTDMTIVRDADKLSAAITATRNRALQNLVCDEIVLERHIEHARHIEIQILGLNRGEVIAIGDRDCSVQRRQQKVLEESPAPRISDTQRKLLSDMAVRAAEAVDYRGAGTIEFVMDVDSGEFYFLDMNTRLQVEHPVTEMVTGLDIVQEQILVASGEESSLGVGAPIESNGHSIEFRVYAEDPVLFLPGPGRVLEWVEPVGGGIRVDSGYEVGDLVTPYYDPLMAKVIVWGRDRSEAMLQLHAAVQEFRIVGPKSNLALLAEILDSDDFYTGDYDTSLLSRLRAPLAHRNN